MNEKEILMMGLFEEHEDRTISTMQQYGYDKELHIVN